MIASLRGRVAAVSPEGAVLEVGGVGLTARCTPATLAGLRVGETARLVTTLVVREDALTLYGFADDDERQVFEVLQTAGGVGPRLALAMLAVHGPDGIRAAIAGDDVPALTRVPGIGRKGAQRIVLELKGRLGAPARPVPASPGAGPAWREQVHAALLGLGWTPREAEEAVLAVAPEAERASAAGEAPVVAELLRSALRSLASR